MSTDDLEQRIQAIHDIQGKYLQVYLRGCNKLMSCIQGTEELNKEQLVSICTSIEQALEKLGSECSE